VNLSLRVMQATYPGEGPTRNGAIEAPPGRLLLKLADFFFSSNAMTFTFEPLVADWHHEYFEALAESRFWKARWLCVRYYWAFAKAFGLARIFDALKAFTQVLTK
jgi:hypothetical protein